MIYIIRKTHCARKISLTLWDRFLDHIGKLDTLARSLAKYRLKICLVEVVCGKKC